MKRLMVGTAWLLLSGLLLAPAMAAGNNDPAQGGAAAAGGVSKTQLELVRKRQAARDRVDEMRMLRTQTIAAEREADEEARKDK